MSHGHAPKGLPVYPELAERERLLRATWERLDPAIPHAEPGPGSPLHDRVRGAGDHAALQPRLHALLSLRERRVAAGSPDRRPLPEDRRDSRDLRSGRRRPDHGRRPDDARSPRAGGDRAPRGGGRPAAVAADQRDQGHARSADRARGRRSLRRRLPRGHDPALHPVPDRGGVERGAPRVHRARPRLEARRHLQHDRACGQPGGGPDARALLPGPLRRGRHGLLPGPGRDRTRRMEGAGAPRHAGRDRRAHPQGRRASPPGLGHRDGRASRLQPGRDAGDRRRPRRRRPDGPATLRAFPGGVPTRPLRSPRRAENGAPGPGGGATPALLAGPGRCLPGAQALGGARERCGGASGSASSRSSSTTSWTRRRWIEERIRNCSFMVWTEDGPVSMCAHNARRDDYVARPVRVGASGASFDPRTGNLPAIYPARPG